MFYFWQINIYLSCLLGIFIINNKVINNLIMCISQLGLVFSDAGRVGGGTDRL